VVPKKNVICTQFSNEIQASVEVLPDAVATFRAVGIPAGVTHQAGQIYKIAKVQSRIPWADPPPLHF
jgi:hypothetical protein